jgi:hypothetical protein|tara:strand:- start:1382 stop:2125 length:744 start_codon:yes stop_codon:yes gene_type:complete
MKNKKLTIEELKQIIKEELAQPDGFLHVDNDSNLIREYWRGAHPEGFFRDHEYGVASLANRIDELMKGWEDPEYARSIAYSNTCRGAGIILELTNIVFEKGGDFFNRVATDGNPLGARALKEKVEQLVEKIKQFRELDIAKLTDEEWEGSKKGEPPKKRDLAALGGPSSCSNENDPIPVDYFGDLYGRNQKNLLNNFYERMERIIASPQETERMQKQQPGYDPSIREGKNIIETVERWQHLAGVLKD